MYVNDDIVLSAACLKVPLESTVCMGTDPLPEMSPTDQGLTCVGTDPVCSYHRGLRLGAISTLDGSPSDIQSG
jgi:hypothetical protein